VSREVKRVIAVSNRLCFFLSGAAGLVYEIVWMRMLGLVFAARRLDNLSSGGDARVVGFGRGAS